MSSTVSVCECMCAGACSASEGVWLAFHLKNETNRWTSLRILIQTHIHTHSYTNIPQLSPTIQISRFSPFPPLRLCLRASLHIIYRLYCFLFTAFFLFTHLSAHRCAHIELNANGKCQQYDDSNKQLNAGI